MTEDPRPGASIAPPGPTPVLPRVVLGTMWPEPDALTAHAVAQRLDVALDSGLSALDTAPLYGLGRTEELLGEAMAGRRSEFLLLGKVGLRWDEEFGDVLFRETLPDGSTVCVRRDSRPASLRHQVEVSLKRLRTDHLDLVQIHQRDRQTPLADSLGELSSLAAEGKVRAIGVSNFDADDTAEAAGILGPHGLASNQLPYSLIDRRVEQHIVPVLEHLSVPLLAYSPTGSGLLGGSRLAAMAQTSRRAAAIQRVLGETLAPIATSLGLSIPQLAVAWVVHRPCVMSAIVGTRDAEQIRGAAAAADVVLDEPTLQQLTDAFRGVTPDMDLGLVTRAGRFARRTGGAVLRRLRAGPGRQPG